MKQIVQKSRRMPTRRHHSKAGSITAKANLVRDFDERNKEEIRKGRRGFTMDEYMQFSAKQKNDKVITKACIELGVSSDQLDIQVVSEGSSGFLESEVNRQLSKLVKYMIM